jgi:hypothetical protein
MSFIRLESTDFVVSSDAITAPAWSTNLPTLTQFYSASSGTSSFYVDIYNDTVGNTNSAIQFSIAYGNSLGSGSAPFNTLVPYVTPTKVNYQQYKTLVYGDAADYFNFGAAATSSFDIFVINVDRNRYKESLFPGTFNLVLSDPNSDNILKLTDNSNDVTTVTYLDCGRAYDIISGSNGTAANSPTLTGATKGYTVSGSYGLLLPDVGLIVLNPRALSLDYTKGGFSYIVTQSNANHKGNETMLGSYINATKAKSFQLNSKETLSSDYVFVRIKNGDYNYSTNPSFTSGSGDLIYSNFIYSPQTYITTVGMYNDNNELLAVAKLSKPLVKDFTKECLIRVKLDF